MLNVCARRVLASSEGMTSRRLNTLLVPVKPSATEGTKKHGWTPTKTQRRYCRTWSQICHLIRVEPHAFLCALVAIGGRNIGPPYLSLRASAIPFERKSLPFPHFRIDNPFDDLASLFHRRGEHNWCLSYSTIVPIKDTIKLWSIGTSKIFSPILCCFLPRVVVVNAVIFPGIERSAMRTLHESVEKPPFVPLPALGRFDHSVE